MKFLRTKRAPNMNIQAALAEAEIAIRHLLADAVRYDGGRMPRAIDVADSKGTVRHRILIVDAVPMLSELYLNAGV
jgi:hypothetical protein